MKKFFIIIAGMLVISCAQETDSQKIKINNTMDKSKAEILKEKRIYFGHQSVGYNLIEGLDELLMQGKYPSIQIVEGKNLELFDAPVLAHSENGTNRDPISKIKGFQETIFNGVGDKVDIAGFKFCYVDFNKSTDVEKLFEQYKIAMEEINNQYPEVRLAHFTVPLRMLENGPKAIINRFLGRDLNLINNEVRQKFNELLVKEYDPNEVFDIARFESTYPDGKRNFKQRNGKNVYSLIPEYSSDGGHLSNIGAKYLSSEFLIFLADRYE